MTLMLREHVFLQGFIMPAVAVEALLLISPLTFVIPILDRLDDTLSRVMVTMTSV